MATLMARPTASEHSEYFGRYITLVPDGDVFDTLTKQIDVLNKELGGLSEKQANYRYAPDQWSIKEVLGHIIDTERVMAYRALCVSRNEKKALPGFEQDDYVRESNFSARTFADLMDEFELVRRSNIVAFRTLPEAMSQRCGTASGSPIGVRALIYIMAGHVSWHIRSLQDEYLAGARKL